MDAIAKATRQPIRMRGRSYVAFTFCPVVPIAGWLEEIDVTLGRSPGFFVGKPVVLDLSALITVGLEQVPTWQARVTFAIARHAAVDLSQVLYANPDASEDRLPAEELEQLRRQLEEVGLRPVRSPDADRRLLRLDRRS